jgi:hypothetical protein
MRDNTGLTPQGFERACCLIIATLENCTDAQRESWRMPPSATSLEGAPSPYLDLACFVPDGGRIWRLRLIVNDAHAVSGVLLVVFVECAAGPPLP